MDDGPHWSEIVLDDDERQRVIDVFFNTQAVLLCKMRSMRRLSGRQASPPPEFSPQANWQDIGKQLRARLIAQADERCDCDWCIWHRHTRPGRREHDWVTAVTLAILGDPSTLVERLNSRMNRTQFDRIVLTDLLEAAFKGEVEAALHPRGRPKKIASHECANMAERCLSRRGRTRL
jgi:hypothetical protein